MGEKRERGERREERGERREEEEGEKRKEKKRKEEKRKEKLTVCRCVHMRVLSRSRPRTTFPSPSFLCRVINPPCHVVVAPPPSHHVVIIWCSLRAVARSGGVWCHGFRRPGLRLVLRRLHCQLQEKKKKLTYGPGDIAVSWGPFPLPFISSSPFVVYLLIPPASSFPSSWLLWSWCPARDQARGGCCLACLGCHRQWQEKKERKKTYLQPRRGRHLLGPSFAPNPVSLPPLSTSSFGQSCGRRLLPLLLVCRSPPPSPPSHRHRSTPRADAREAGGGWFSFRGRCGCHGPSPPSSVGALSPLVIVVPPIIHPMRSCS